MNVELAKVRTAVEFIIGRGDRPVVGEVGLTPRAKRVIELAIDEARRLGHNYIGTEHLLLGLVREGEGIAAGVLESLGVNLDKVRHEVIRVLTPEQLRGARPGDEARQQDPDGRRARHQPHRGRPRGQARPGHRPREGDRAGHPDPRPQDQEQPGPDRRAGRRQDGHRRGPGAPHRRRRRPGHPAQQAGPDARHRLARRRHEVPRRVRGAPQEDHRGAPEHQRRDPVHRRAPHARRRGRGRGRDRRREHPQAAAQPRRAPVHRRDDARRVPQVHREGRGARAALPAGHGRGAHARADDRDPQGDPRPLRAAPQGHDHRRRDPGRRGPRDPLHHRPPPARQGDRPHRRGRQPRPPPPLLRPARAARRAEGAGPDHQGEGRGDQRPGVRAGRDPPRGRGHLARERRHSCAPPGRRPRPASRPRSTRRRSPRSSRCGPASRSRASPRRSPSGCSRWRRSSTSG